MSDVIITLNGEALHLPAGSSLADCIAKTNQVPESLATAINGEFVARHDRASRELFAGDTVFTFQAITGG